jgi:hypothetical protein
MAPLQLYKVLFKYLKENPEIQEYSGIIPGATPQHPPRNPPRIPPGGQAKIIA